MSDPLHVLKHEHRIIEQALRALDGICLKLTWGEQVPSATLSDVLDFIQTYCGQHHEKEQTYLLPALKKQGFFDTAPAITTIIEEHDAEGEIVEELKSAIAEFSSGHPEARNRLIEAVRRYVDLTIPHIQREEGILFRIAEDILDEGAKAAMMAGFQEAEKCPGPDAMDRCEELASQLERDWSL